MCSLKRSTIELLPAHGKPSIAMIGRRTPDSISVTTSSKHAYFCITKLFNALPTGCLQHTTMSPALAHWVIQQHPCMSAGHGSVPNFRPWCRTAHNHGDGARKSNEPAESLWAYLGQLT
jgi:hypothetical protein